ncbi:MAG: tyrosine-type recombinase/integrase [Methylobacter sp.]
MFGYTCHFSVTFAKVDLQSYAIIKLQSQKLRHELRRSSSKGLAAWYAYHYYQNYPGLRLTASTTTRTWVYRYKSPVDGRMRQTALGHWPTVSFPSAIVAWETLKANRDKGIDPALEAKKARNLKRDAIEEKRILAEGNAYTVRILCDDYLAGYIALHRAKKGADEVERMFNTMLGDIGNMPATSITRSCAFDFIQSYITTAPVQAGRLRCELGAAWDYAMDAGRLPDTAANWWRLILRGKIRSKGKPIAGERIGTVKRVLSDDEVGELIAWLPNFTQTVADVLTLYLWTGTRGAEISAMTGAEVKELDGQFWWMIPKTKTKNARHNGATDQLVPLFGRGLAVVKRRKKLYGDGFLFPARNKPGGHIQQKFITEQAFWRQPYCNIRPESNRPRLTVTHWAPHDLRRTTRTILAKIGCPDAVGEMVLGHMLPGISGTYNRHQYDAEKVEWLGKLSDYLEGLIK